uniref:Uncharacterized protein n=1 Tax=Panagrolaimus sp. ES5 TaxID=591445 RepID=A0AC34GTJ2_9BILA
MKPKESGSGITALEEIGSGIVLDKYPPDIVKWMRTNAEPKLALKLMKVSKRFQHKNGFPFMVVKNVFNIRESWVYSTLDGKEYITQQIQDIPKKLWMSHELTLRHGHDLISTILCQTAAFSIQSLQLYGQKITIEEFRKFTHGGIVKSCILVDTTITDKNGEPVYLETLFECLPNASKIKLSRFIQFQSLKSLDAKMARKLLTLSLLVSPENSKELQKLVTFMEVFFITKLFK